MGSVHESPAEASTLLETEMIRQFQHESCIRWLHFRSSVITHRASRIVRRRVISKRLTSALKTILKTFIRCFEHVRHQSNSMPDRHWL